ncbi:putative disease resistance RPP13-like protein 1 [Eucalyptus grandis]|uniref:putative disease resistance RPP13-like protein 1 n=1 Tax=Eucalyptus grandis TaxID=71139 RepID=UPI00192E9493|nr:putative disease resistance RPP13-like protein 1 [Eucalyptus grandis]
MEDNDFLEGSFEDEGIAMQLDQIEAINELEEIAVRDSSFMDIHDIDNEYKPHDSFEETDSPTAIGEIFLSSLFEVLFSKFASLGLDYAQREGISITPLDEWKGMLETINIVLDDAEDKQLGENRLVKSWLDDVRDLAYDMEDLLDEFMIEVAQVKSGAESSTSKGQKKRLFPFFGQDGSSGSNSNPCLNLFETKGRRKKQRYLELLINEVENSDARLSIVPIVGMGGVGKTAMAQRLYNDPKMSSYFERKAWVCVSDVFDVLNITKTILQSITGLSCEGKDLNWLQVKLKDDLSEKKFLVVLDDVWNEKYGEWTSLLKPFEAGAKGSKIIITTRNHSVVSITGASPYSLKELSVDNCTNLLAYHALEARNFERHPHLK